MSERSLTSILFIHTLDSITQLELIAEHSKISNKPYSIIPPLYTSGYRLVGISRESPTTGELNTVKCPDVIKISPLLSNLTHVFRCGSNELFSGVEDLVNVFYGERNPNIKRNIELSIYLLPENASLTKVMMNNLSSIISVVDLINNTIPKNELFYHWYLMVDECLYINRTDSGDLLIATPSYRKNTQTNPYSSIGIWCCLNGTNYIGSVLWDFVYREDTGSFVSYFFSPEHQLDYIFSTDSYGIADRWNTIIGSINPNINHIEPDLDEFGLAILHANARS